MSQLKNIGKNAVVFTEPLISHLLLVSQGAFTGQQQITVQSEDGQSYVAVNPDTIIVQDSDELVIAGDGQEGEQQYVIQYVTQPPAPEDGAMVGEVTEVANTEVVTEGHQLVDQQVGGNFF